MQNMYIQSYSEYSELESSQTPGSKFPETLPFKCASKLDLNVETFTELPDPSTTELNKPRILELEPDFDNLFID